MFIGYPGDAKWVMDQGLGDGASWSVGRPDLWLSDCYVDGCYNSADTNNWFWKATWWSASDSPSQSRMTIWNNVLHDFQGARAVPGDSNCGWFSFLSPRYPPQYEQRQHFTLAKNIFDGGTPTTSAGPNYGSCCDFYGTKNSVIEHNIVKKWGIYFPFWLKVQDHHWSIRANLNWDQGDFNATTRANQTVSTPLSEYVLKGGFVEYCWNFSWSASGSHFGTQEYNDGQANPFYVYRNTGVTTGTKYVAPFGILHADDMEDNAEPTNVAIGLNNLAIDVKIDAINNGPWRIHTWDNRVVGTLDDAAAKAAMPLGTFSGNVWGQQILIDFTTGAATGTWDVYNGLKGAYIV